LQLTLPTRSTNMSFIKLTNQHGIKAQTVYEVSLLMPYNTNNNSLSKAPVTRVGLAALGTAACASAQSLKQAAAGVDVELDQAHQPARHQGADGV
jgi:hypothetical protein